MQFPIRHSTPLRFCPVAWALLPEFYSSANSGKSAQAMLLFANRHTDNFTSSASVMDCRSIRKTWIQTYRPICFDRRAMRGRNSRHFQAICHCNDPFLRRQENRNGKCRLESCIRETPCRWPNTPGESLTCFVIDRRSPRPCVRECGPMICRVKRSICQRMHDLIVELRN